MDQKQTMNSRTTREFSVPTDIWPLVDRWTGEEDFSLLDDAATKKSYCKKLGSLAPATRVEIDQNGDTIRLEAWLEPSMFNKVLSFFTAPKELALESGKGRMVVPRTIARDSVNRLLVHLAQPLIP
jgi:hypothetical protein